jgi:hypothetical protein
MFQSAADCAYFIYQHDFSVAAPAGTRRQLPSEYSSSSSSGHQEVSDFVIDATCCLQSNPLAHLLDYRAVQLDSGRLAYPLKFSQRHSVADGPNAMLVPLSDNNTGKVYCAVIALQDFQPGEELCIDYGVACWQVRDQQLGLRYDLPQKHTKKSLHAGPGSVCSAAQRQMNCLKPQWLK